MKDIFNYLIDVCGQVDENELNANSPLYIYKILMDMTVTRLAIHTDQSGLIGLMRHLHGRGFVILSVSRQ